MLYPSLLLTALLAATPPAPPAPPASPSPVKLAAPGLTVVGLDAKLGEFLGEHLAQQLSLRGLRVLTGKQLSALVGFERQKELLGCRDAATSCLTELANALGAEGLVLGEIGKLGGTYQVNLKVVGASDARPLGAFTAQATREEQLLGVLSRGAEALASEVLRTLGRTGAAPPAAVAASAAPHPTDAAPVSALRAWSWLPAAGGLALGAAGTLSLLQARSRYAALDQPGQALTSGEARALRDAGVTFQGLGLAGVGAGVAGLAAGMAMWALGAEAPVQPGLAAGPGGFQLQVSHRFE